MKWEEMIQMRRQKESRAKCPFDLNASSSRYHALLNQIIGGLSQLERSAITLRFMDVLPIARVADRMGMSWDGADQLIDRATTEIQKQFSRTGSVYLGGIE